MPSRTATTCRHTALHTETRRLTPLPRHLFSKAMLSTHLTSASEHQALVAKLRQELASVEASYRQAKGVRSSLEAEVDSLKRQVTLHAVTVGNRG